MNGGKKYIKITIVLLALLLTPPFTAQSDGADSWEIKTPQRFMLDNGIVVHFIENNELPLLRVNVIVRGGSFDAPDGREGAAGLMFSAMRMGTKTYPVQDIDDRLDASSIFIAVNTGEEYSTISLATLQESTDEGLRILASVISEPSFVDSGWNALNMLKTFWGIRILKEMAQNSVRRLEDNQVDLAINHSKRILFNGTQRYRIASLASIDAIGREDLIALYKRCITPVRVHIAASGAITAEELKKKLNGVLGAWRAPEQDIPQRKAVKAPDGGVYFIVKDFPQSMIFKVYLAPKKASAEEYPFELVNAIIGGEASTSRLFRKIRTEHGYAYETGSAYRPYYEDGLMAVYALVGTKDTIPTLDLMNKILSDIHKESFTAQEIEKTKAAIRNRFVFLFASPVDVAQKFAEIEYAKLPSDLYSRYLERIAAVTSEDMRKVASAYIGEEKSLTVIVGQKELLEKLKGMYPKIVVIGDEGSRDKHPD